MAFSFLEKSSWKIRLSDGRFFRDFFLSNYIARRRVAVCRPGSGNRTIVFRRGCTTRCPEDPFNVVYMRILPVKVKNNFHRFALKTFAFYSKLNQIVIHLFRRSNHSEEP
jgi:hypothetical protein